MTSYQEIFERFSQKITDYKLLELSDNDIHDMLKQWMASAISKFRRCHTDLSDRDDELEEFNTDLLDIEKEILAELMVGEWLEPQLNSVLYTSQFFGGKEEKSELLLSVRLVLKRQGVFLRICWNTLRVIIPKQRNEICSSGMVKNIMNWVISREDLNRIALNDYELKYS